MRKAIGDSGLSFLSFVIFCGMVRALATSPIVLFGYVAQVAALAARFRDYLGLSAVRSCFAACRAVGPCGGGLIRVHSRSPLREIFVFGLRGAGADRKLCV
jgi:hypothetical protein